MRFMIIVKATPESEAGVVRRLRDALAAAKAGRAPAPAPPSDSDLRAPVRLAIDFENAADLADKAGKD